MTLEDREAPEAAPERTVVQLARATRPQAVVLAGQLVAGLTNLIVAIAFARVLPSGEYADVAAFLALYLLVHAPAVALSAAGALDPQRLLAARRNIAIGACICCVLAAIGCRLVGEAVGVPAPMMFVLALALPGAGLLGLQRGVAAGTLRYDELTRSLVAEPVVRLAAGVGLAMLVGPVGAAVGVVVGGYVALWVCRLGQLPGVAAEHRRPRSDAVGIAVVFVVLVAMQTVDLLVANRRLAPLDAARFSALSTLGGAAVFATATIPLVLLPATVRKQEAATVTAIVLAAVVGFAVALGGAVVAGPLMDQAFGADYAAAASMLGPYLVAMALLGVGRVLAAQRCAAGETRFVVGATVGVLAVDVVALCTVGASVTAIASTTLIASALLVMLLAAPEVVRAPARQVRTWAGAISRPTALAMAGLITVATVLRTMTNRGLWVDEAISVHQAQMPFGRMLADMQTTDVHPPLHYALLWVTVRVFGISEFAVRLPSLIAGVAFVPALFWTGKVIYDRRTGWVAATIGVFAPFCVWYSQEARMYAQFMLFATLAVGAQVQAIRRGRRGDWVVYTMATAAMLWTQYFAFLPWLVQQFGFAVAWRQRRRDPAARRALAVGWGVSSAVIVVVCLPLLAFVRGQFLAYRHRTDALVPGQAGVGSSTLGGAVSVYAIGANLIWALWGYHSDGAMERIAALWPLLMLVGLLALGRGRSGPSVLLLALVVVPLAALFLVGSVKRDLFELRYFSGAVPAALLLVARFVTSTTRRRVALLSAGALAVGTLGVGLLDQQTNGANPRLYDFEGALATVRNEARPGDVLVYEPNYLADVIEYYAPKIATQPLDAPLPTGTGAVWVLATDRVVNSTETASRVGTVLANLEQSRTLVETTVRPNVRIWELR